MAPMNNNSALFITRDSGFEQFILPVIRLKALSLADHPQNHGISYENPATTDGETSQGSKAMMASRVRTSCIVQGDNLANDCSYFCFGVCPSPTKKIISTVPGELCGRIVVLRPVHLG